MTIENLLEKLWIDYTTLNPSTKRVYDLLMTKESQVYNDHIAFRTFSGKCGIDALSKTFCKLGYKEIQDYQFPVKKLYAKHFEHENSELPKVFISELKQEEFSDDLQKVVQSCIDSITNEDLSSEDFCVKGRLWDADYNTYQKLVEESEYAGWLYAFGFRANHFTVNINRLESFSGIEDLNEFILQNGYELNSSGGLIKGSPEELLEQSSTMAKKISTQFSDGNFEIPACYYEFARRYPDNNGKLFSGFVATSADKIFESTNRY